MRRILPLMLLLCSCGESVDEFVYGFNVQMEPGKAPVVHPLESGYTTFRLGNGTESLEITYPGYQAINWTSSPSCPVGGVCWKNITTCPACVDPKIKPEKCCKNAYCTSTCVADLPRWTLVATVGVQNKDPLQRTWVNPTLVFADFSSPTLSVYSVVPGKGDATTDEPLPDVTRKIAPYKGFPVVTLGDTLAYGQTGVADFELWMRDNDSTKNLVPFRFNVYVVVGSAALPAGDRITIPHKGL